MPSIDRRCGTAPEVTILSHWVTSSALNRLAQAGFDSVQLTRYEEHGIAKFEIVDLRQHVMHSRSRRIHLYAAAALTHADRLWHTSEEILCARCDLLTISCNRRHRYTKSLAARSEAQKACPRPRHSDGVSTLGAFYRGWGGVTPCRVCNGSEARVKGCIHCAAEPDAAATTAANAVATANAVAAAATAATAAAVTAATAIVPPHRSSTHRRLAQLPAHDSSTTPPSPPPAEPRGRLLDGHPRGTARPCTASELLSGAWYGEQYVIGGSEQPEDARHRTTASCSFEPFTRESARACLQATDVVITGNSVARGLHLELADLLGAQSRVQTREEEKRRCPLPFGAMFKDNPQLFDAPRCMIRLEEANVSLHFVWQVSFASREINGFYRRLFDAHGRSRRRLLLSTMAVPNECAAWSGGGVGRNLSWNPSRVMPCVSRLLAQWPASRDYLAEAVARLPAMSTWVLRTHPAVRTALPRVTYQSDLSDELANLQREVVDAALLAQPPPPAAWPAAQMLDFYLATREPADRIPTASSPTYYEDAIHPARPLQRLQAQMLLHLHCRVNLHQ